jgi:hypothetical protein
VSGLITFQATLENWPVIVAIQAWGSVTRQIVDDHPNLVSRETCVLILQL